MSKTIQEKPAPTLDELRNRRADIQRQFEIAVARERSAALPLAIEALDRAAQALAECESVYANAEAEAYRIEHDQLLEEHEAARVEHLRAGAEAAEQRRIVADLSTAASDPSLHRLARTPDGALALAERQNELNTGSTLLALRAASADAAYARFAASGKRLDAFRQRHGQRVGAPAERQSNADWARRVMAIDPRATDGMTKEQRSAMNAHLSGVAG